MKRRKTAWRQTIRRAVLIGAMTLGILGGSVTVHAARQTAGSWQQDAKGWWFLLEDGGYARQTWLSEGDTWYAFDENGYMITGWCRLDGSWYYFGENGAMETGWLEEDGLWYLFDETGEMVTGWIERDGIWYYLHANGSMAADTWIDGCYLNASGAWVEGQTQQTDLSAKITAAIDRLRAKFPEGSYWNHMGTDTVRDFSDTVTAVPCNHAAYGLSYCNSYILGKVQGYQCDGFARKMSDEVFGKTAGRTDYAYDYAKIKPGDYLRYSNSGDSFISNGHSVFVIDKKADKLIVVEANYGGSCMIHWDGTLTKEYLDSVYVECFTRY